MLKQFSLETVGVPMPYDNVYGFEQNLRIENAVSPPPHHPLKLCWRSVAKDSVLMCADQRTQ